MNELLDYFAHGLIIVLLIVLDLFVLIRIKRTLARFLAILILTFLVIRAIVYLTK